MKAILRQFIDNSLFDAAAAMLEHLKIKFSPQTKVPISFAELYSGATSSSLPMALADVYSKVTNSYFIGTIDEDSLKGIDSSFDLAQPIEGKYATMLVFATELKPGSHLTRTELATLTRGFNRMASALPVILFIKNGKYLSLASCERSEYKQSWRDGEKLGKVAILRDIDCTNPHRGHLDILESIGDKEYPTFDELYAHWLEVFSSELLTKKFYTELSEWYAWVISSGEVKFPNDINTTDDDAKYNHEAVIRLITRLIFVWFLKQKHLIPEEFFDEKFIRENFIENFDPHSTNSLFYDPRKSKYYRLILQNLFFAMLNRPIMGEEAGTGENRRFVSEKRFQGKNQDYNINNLLRYKSEFAPGGAELLLGIANSKVPFLNGGLFECLDDKDNGKYYDGFSERKASLEQLAFPDYFFFGDEVGADVDLSSWYEDSKKNHIKVRGLVDILKRYNFTVEENTPLDQEVSLDPELLGKVFENLLASFNPETNTTARKQTGSFYTPREVVQFMVDESIIAYLSSTCGKDKSSLYRNLISYSSDAAELSSYVKDEIIKALYNCKILDPACGSGAFPMGVLQQMVHLLRKLDPSNELWREFILDIALARDKEAYLELDEQERNRKRADIEQSFNRSVNDPDYARKLYLIENCIYGVDIQPIAVQISKLRFFISLVAEQKPTTDAASNFGIRPLPNLEAKFVAANTLLQLQKESNLFASSDELEKTRKQLSEANHLIFRARRNREKKNLRTRISTLRKLYGQQLYSLGSIGPSAAQLVADWDMFDQNSSASFFDLEWMFGMQNGFDIVIGNPPYIQLQNNKGELARLYEGYKFNTFARTGDIYCLFYERGYQLLKQGGHLCFITSNKWMRAAYGEKIREFFAKNTNPLMLIDFGGVKIFESATVDTNVLLYAKENNAKSTACAVVNKQNKDSVKNLSDFVQQNATEIAFVNSENWIILSPIELSIKHKIEAIGTPLRDWDIQINYGIKTGYNDAFIITTETRNKILAACIDESERARTEELIRPILRGRDIKRYGYDWANLWIINAHNGIKGRLERVHIEDYPAVKAHLDRYWDKLAKRTDKGDTPYNLRNCAYVDDFSQPKIIYPNMTKFLPFVYDNQGYLTNQKCFIITGKRIAFLTAFLNSSLFKYCYKNNFPQLLDETRELSKIFFEQISVIEVSEDTEQFIYSKIIDIQQSYTKDKAVEIDQIVFDLYNLTQEEREAVGFIEIQ